MEERFEQRPRQTVSRTFLRTEVRAPLRAGARDLSRRNMEWKSGSRSAHGKLFREHSCGLKSALLSAPERGIYPAGTWNGRAVRAAPTANCFANIPAD